MLPAIVLLALLLLPLALYAEGRRRSARWQEWSTALTPRGQRTFDEMYREMNDEWALLDIALVAAADAQQLGSTAEAIRLLEAGGRLIESHAPTMRRLLLGMAVLSRMVAAMAPIEPLRARDFNMRQIAGLAYFNRLFHNLLITSAERFRFRAQILRAAFVVVMRYWFRIVARIRRDRKAEAEAAWLNMEALRKDIHTLTDESLATFRVLVLSLSATPEMRAGRPHASPLD